MTKKFKKNLKSLAVLVLLILGISFLITRYEIVKEESIQREQMKEVIQERMTRDVYIIQDTVNFYSIDAVNIKVNYSVQLGKVITRGEELHYKILVEGVLGEYMASKTSLEHAKELDPRDFHKQLHKTHPDLKTVAVSFNFQFEEKFIVLMRGLGFEYVGGSLVSNEGLEIENIK